MTPIRLVISGCCGRMGSLIAEEAARDSAHFRIVGALEQPGHPQAGQPLPAQPALKVSTDAAACLQGADLLIEFTAPEATLANARAAAQARVAMLIGTTGLTLQQLEELRALARQIPVFWSPNMSIGIVILRRLIGSLYGLYRKFGLEGSASIQLSETHHIRKKDKPSGTAKLLAEEVRKVTGRSIPDEEIEARREGEVVGLHSLSIQTGAEKITLQHEALDRRVFAQGALVAARHFMQSTPKPGLYGMDDFVQ